jgi:predicted ester cyclase
VIGEGEQMSASSQGHRIELIPTVRGILESGSPESQLLQHFVRYLQALLDPDTAGINHVTTPDVCCHLLEEMGIPRGREGLKMFRRQANAAMPDEHILVTAVRFDGDDIIEVDMVMNATHSGELFGIPTTGRRFRFEVHERARFVDGKMAERWPQADFEDIKRQLTGPIQ